MTRQDPHPYPSMLLYRRRTSEEEEEIERRRHDLRGRAIYRALSPRFTCILRKSSF